MQDVRFRILDGVAIEGLVVSMFGFMAVAFFDCAVYPLAGAWALPLQRGFGYLYVYTLGEAQVPGGMGVAAGIYLLGMLASFMLLNRKTPLLKNLLHTLVFASVVCVLFELLLCSFGPGWMGVYVITAQKGTSFAWFTNADLLWVALGFFVSATGFELRRRATARPPLNPDRTQGERPDSAERCSEKGRTVAD